MTLSPSLPVLDVEIQGRVDDFRLGVAFQAGSEITALFGPSGAGKSLTLRYLAGLATPESGGIRLRGRTLFRRDPVAPAPAHSRARAVNLPARDRRVGMVFQEHALFPHLSVAGNVAFGMSRLPRQERRSRAEELLALVGLGGYGERTPRSLSGGERQRVALARALAAEPELLLLDEPFAALDFRVRQGLREALLELQGTTGIPMVLVTHSLTDVRRLSSSLVLLDRGEVQAAGPTARMLEAPPSEEAALLLSGEGE